MAEKLGDRVSRILKQVVPPLDGTRHKGQGGRIGIFGGSSDYTGAPFYAGTAALRTGAEMVYVFCAAEAAVPLKCYSPELMVTPVYSGEGDADSIARAIGQVLPRLHVLVVGCGLGRKPAVMRGAALAVQAALAQNIPVLIDADGLFMVAEDLVVVKGSPLVALTPNVREFRSLCDAAGVALEKGSGETPSPPSLADVQALSAALGGVTVCLKGPEDRIVSRLGECACAEMGTPRRSGGLGDVLAGVMGAALAWLGPQPPQGIGRGNLALHDAALAASFVTRRSCRRAYEKRKRAMTAPDVLEEIGEAFEEVCPAEALASD